jgi:hypothetical protein
MRNANGGRGFLRRVSGFANDIGQAWEQAEAQRSARDSAIWRRCPYCAEPIDLAMCKVISAARGGRQAPGSRHAVGRSSFDNLGPSEGADASDSAGAWRQGTRVLYDPKAAQRTGTGTPAGGGAGGGLVPLDSIDRKLVPRRLCGRCGHLLPKELDQWPAKILSVVGVTSAGKTIYLTQSLREATLQQSLKRFGCDKLVPTDADETAEVLHNGYFERLFRRRELHGATNPKEEPRQFTLTAEVGQQEFLVVTHDIAGETISDPYGRAEELVFLPYADAIIFLIDPVDFDAVRVRAPAHVIGPGKPANQVHVLRQCLAELDEAGRAEVPVRVAVAKADLLATYCGIDGPWRQPPAADWKREVTEIDAAVRSMLYSIGEAAVVDAVGDRQRVLFHAVSSLGAAPDENGRLTEGTPFRCSDPLGSALFSMAYAPMVTG